MSFSSDTLLLFSPLPPKENGIADYVAEQLPFHCRDFSVVAVIDNADPEPVGLPRGVQVLRLAEYQRHQAELARFPHLYHVGNNPDHGYLLPVLYSVPGVVVVHDLGLHHLIDTQTIVKGKYGAYAWALWQQYGQAGKVLGDQFQRLGWKGRELAFEELKLNGAVIDAAQHVIVHSRYSASRIRSESPAKPVAVVPHHLSPAIRYYHRARREEYRRILGLPLNSTVITSLGFINRAKQIPAVLEALARLKAEGLSFHYVLAGKCRTDEYDVWADIERLKLKDEVRVTGYLDEYAFFCHIAATDLVVNLRYPIGGETSGTLTRALGMGRCCMVVDIGPFSEVPSRCAVKLPWSKTFPDTLLRALRELITTPAQRMAYENAARDWIGATHGIDRTTAAYHQVIRGLRSQAVPQALLGWAGTEVAEFPDERAIEQWMCRHTDLLREAVGQGAGHLWWRQGLVPWPDGRPLPLLAEQPEPVRQVLCELLGYDDSQVQAAPVEPLQWEPLAAQAYRLWPRALACLPPSAAADPMAWLAALNWRLQPAAELVVWIPSGPPLEKGPAQTWTAWRDYLVAAGFEVLAGHEAPSEVTFSGLEAPQAELAFRVRKLCERVERAPQPWYKGCAARHLLLPALRGVLPACEAVELPNREPDPEEPDVDEVEYA